ncbi:hypothetical protein [Streptomyces mirabilis]|uniref:hypothetical protein n=1 Tax=Streptomyces mirabilis TaxID=68239 RepID=UPI003676E90D
MGVHALSAGLDLRLDDRGVPEGQPFLISPAGRYDVTLNRYFSVGRWVGVTGVRRPRTMVR